MQNINEAVLRSGRWRNAEVDSGTPWIKTKATVGSLPGGTDGRDRVTWGARNGSYLGMNHFLGCNAWAGAWGSQLLRPHCSFNG